MEKENMEKKPILPTYRKMKVGETQAWPMCQLASIRSNTSMFGLMSDKKFKSHVNREKGVIEVTRVK